MKVLLTGASGFTGRHMTELLLKEGHEVAPLKSNLLDLESLRTEVKAASPDWVVHLGALSFVAHQDEEAFYRVNVFGTLNLLQAIHDSNKKPNKILIASSANVYGTPDVEVIDESIPPKPVNHYACSKLAMEYMVQTWFDKLPIIITRPFNYTGPGQDERFVIPKIVSHFARREPEIELGNIHVSRDFSDVRDVALAYLQLLQSEQKSIIFNICSGTAISLQEMIDTISNLAGYQIKIKINPAFVRENEIRILRGNNAYLKAMVPSFTMRDINLTIRDMYDNYLSSHR